jgi:hypothetical protein
MGLHYLAPEFYSTSFAPGCNLLLLPSMH